MPTSYRILRYHDGATGRPQTKAGHTWVHSAGNAYPTPSRDPPTRRVDFIVNTSPALIVTRTTVGHRQLRLRTKQEVHGWLNENPRIRAHFTPTSCIVDRGSWMNIVAIWFGIIERQAIHRGAFGDVRELTAAIRTYITGWLQQSSPPLRLDPRPRGNPQESQPSPNFKRGPPLSIEMAKYPLTSGCTGSIPGAGNHPAVRAVIVPRELNPIDFNKRKAR
jgi:hypothetical protein